MFKSGPTIEYKVNTQTVIIALAVVAVVVVVAIVVVDNDVGDDDNYDDDDDIFEVVIHVHVLTLFFQFYELGELL